VPQLIFLADRCTRCGACAAICEEGVHVVTESGHVLDHARCRVCRHCVRQCPLNALQIKGYSVAADEVVVRAIRLRPFFEHSGGGVTLTGGEVTDQADFAAAILAGCRAEGIHTAIETAGTCDWPTLERLADLCDLILYDLKLIDEDEHLRWTGRANRRILENARRLAGRSVQIRVPLIPGVTDTEENLQGIFAFMKGAGLTRVALLPFNPATAAKYEWLGRRCPIEADPRAPSRHPRLLELAGNAGLEAALG
jgi:pyruvate formate lyase activating enzyme